MRILLVSNLYPPVARGGAEMIVKTTAEELARQGHQVTVLAGDRGLDGVEALTVNGVEVMRFSPKLPYFLLDDTDQPLTRRLRWHAKDLFSASSGRVFRDVLDEVRPDVVISHNLRGLGLAIARVLASGSVPWVHVLHDIQLLVPSGQKLAGQTPVWQRPPALPFYQWATKHAFGSPDLVVGPTNFVIDAHKERGFFKESSMLVLQNPVDEGDSSSFEQWSSLAYAGQLAYGKGLDLLLEAARLIKTPITIDIMGDGPARVSLMNQAATLPERVTVNIHGKVPHAEVLERFAQSGAVVLPSRTVENCPGVLLEARRTGARIIGPNQGGVPELIDASGLFEAGSARSLAQALQRLIDGEVPKSSPNGLLTSEVYVRQFVAALALL